MKTFLASIPLTGRTVVVVGGGEPGLAKARLMARTPARLVWFIPHGAAPDRHALDAEIVHRLPSRADLEDAALVFIALSDEEGAVALAIDARSAGALVNVVDRPDLGQFHTPALVDRGEVVIGIATGGSAPILARDLRARIEAVLPQGLDLLGRIAGDIRDTVKATIPDFLARRRFWEKAFRGRAAELAAAGDEPGAQREVLRLLNGVEPPKGSVWLVGAGPGDPELLTLMALRILQDADVIIHDRLVPEAILDRARRDARRIYVGKARSDHSVPQGEINQLLIDEARAGQRVVRLKGGDPFVFGRGGEELEALRAAGIETHVVPGVTAALACAAAAGVPLTHRDHAQAVTFVTGHSRSDGPAADWIGLSSNATTLAVYMGVDQAGGIAAQLLAAGRDPSTPVAVVIDGSLPSEQVLSGVLADLGGLVERGRVDRPAILFIGETAAFASHATLAVEQPAARAVA